MQAKSCPLPIRGQRQSLGYKGNPGSISKVSNGCDDTERAEEAGREGHLVYLVVLERLPSKEDYVKRHHNCKVPEALRRIPQDRFDS